MADPKYYTVRGECRVFAESYSEAAVLAEHGSKIDWKPKGQCWQAKGAMLFLLLPSPAYWGLRWAEGVLF